ncbi:U3 small nucleolar RNA-associated protein 25 [Calycina marina]|uniref:U3 small nucleolar RNA-associated protein 25 n=1 Tax=Calycina marina TaxID=1763456 RepID=A0A9P8CH19_9HELO|nr:U3 small nucleolar RNA-associated protein 25 [Calycina marina]
MARGRGRGGPRGGRSRSVYDSARLAQKEAREENGSSESESSSGEEQQDLEEDLSSDADDEEELPSKSSYATLLESLTSGPQAKRRKIIHVQEPMPVIEVTKLSIVSEPVIADSEEDSDDELEDASDPFEVHFADPDENILSKRLEALQLSQWSTQRVVLPNSETGVLSIPGAGETPSGHTFSKVRNSSDLKLHKKLVSIVEEQRPQFDELESTVAPLMFNYQDMLFYERKVSNVESLRRLVCLHAINHIFKTRERVMKNKVRLEKEQDPAPDQGYTRPKVLMLLYSKQSCVKMIKMITSLCKPDQQEKRNIFNDRYMEKEESLPSDKPADFKELFEGKEDNEEPLFGLKWTKRTIKFFSGFYNSDIIFASPLGLRRVVEGRGGKKPQKGDYDFLSSIEVVIVDQTDAHLMQSWEHMEYIFQHLNLQPKDLRDADISRIRPWYLDLKAKYFRQTITLAAFNTPEINSLFFNQSKNWAGKIKVTPTYTGKIECLQLKVKQTFSRLESPSFTDDPDARFTYFTTVIIPTLVRRAKDTTGTIIFIPSSFDFDRLRNYFSASTSLSFGSISEYTPVPDRSRAQSHFLNGRHSVLLYTERAHHFFRFRLRGVKKIVMYGLPENPIFYKEIVGGFLARSVTEGNLEHGRGSVRVMFSKWDRLKFERIVGTERTNRMITDKGDTFDFV